MKRLPDSYPRLVLVAFCLVTAVALIAAGSTTAAPFGAYNPSWDGGAGLRTTADAVGATPVVVQNTTTMGDYPANETTAVIIAPDSAYTRQESRAVSEFVRAGGTLLVADDTPTHTNKLLAALEARARVDGRPIRDERHHYRSPTLPVATNVSEHSLTRNISTLTLNYGTPVRPNGATVLVSTSEYAYLDEHANGALDTTESLESRPVATVEQIGSGEVIVVGDPSLFINAMLKRPDNQQFATNVFSQYRYVLIDHTHTAQIPPVMAALLAIRSSAGLQLLIGGVGLALIAVWAARPDSIAHFRHRMLGTRTRNDAAVDQVDVEAAVKRAHPEWDGERIQRVTQGVKPHHEKGDANDRPR